MRLEAQAKAGYYPTPQEVILIIKSLVQTSKKQHIRALDPCCGTGEALKDITEHLNSVDTYGVELHKERARSASATLDHVLESDFTQSRISARTFDLILLNPPYDDDGPQRVEHQFLIRATKLLKASGTLIYLVPMHSLEKSAAFLSANFFNIEIASFPRADYPRFKPDHSHSQAKRSPIPQPREPGKPCALRSATMKPEYHKRTRVRPKHPIIPEDFAISPIIITTRSSKQTSIMFIKLVNVAKKAYEQMMEQGLWADGTAKELFQPEEDKPTLPLMPLRVGHIATLTAAGMLNNIILGEGSRQDPDKGTIFKKRGCNRRNGW